jgi:hypothetical protein
VALSRTDMDDDAFLRKVLAADSPQSVMAVTLFGLPTAGGNPRSRL